MMPVLLRLHVSSDSEQLMGKLKDEILFPARPDGPFIFRKYYNTKERIFSMSNLYDFCRIYHRMLLHFIKPIFPA